ncbi:PIN domain-containing protein [Pseudonocardia sp. GCM10023141]|uniref:PIN domain-containing protein n=1 Tax=Pseudonocardia sp. GCM10023141 TaxID=3252653 RepID=UPI00361B9EF0
MTAAVERQVLLDTSVVIEPPAAGLSSIADVVAISTVTIAELEYGVGAASDPIGRQRRRRRLQLVIETFDIVPFDLATAASYGMLANAVRAAGRDPRPRRLDLMIAASAERHGYSIATRNARDLQDLRRVLDVIAVI